MHSNNKASSLTALVFLTMAFAGTPARAGSVTFTMTELWAPQGGWSVANDINDLGQVAGFVQTGALETRRAAVWQPDQTLKLALGEATYSEASALNNLGQAVGYVGYGSGQTRAALWNGTQLQVLGTAGQWGDRANGINDSGLVVGSVIASNHYQHAAAWQNGQLTDVGAATLPMDSASTANGVNQAGQIVGSSGVGGLGNHTPLIWDAFSGQYAIEDHGGYYGGTSINDLGQVLSIRVVTIDGKSVAQPLVVQGSLVTQLLPDNQDGMFFKINNAGQAVGSAGLYTAMLWSPSGGTVSINNYLQGGTSISGVRSINQYGQMAVSTTGNRAAILTPTGTVRWSGHTGGSFVEAANWDSGLGFAPNKFLDAEIATTDDQDVIGPGYDLTVKRLTVGGGGGISRLLLVDYGRLDATGGTRLLSGGRLVPFGGEALFATGHLAGDLTMQEGSGLEFKAGDAAAGSFDRLVIEGALQIDGGDFILTLDGQHGGHLGDRYDFIDATSINGHFTHLVLPTLAIGLAWDSSLLYSEGVLSVRAVPEPSTAALLLAGLFGLAGVARRTRRAGRL